MLLHTNNLSPFTTFLPKTLCPSFQIELNIFNRKSGSLNTKVISTSTTNGTKIQAYLIETPVLWLQDLYSYALAKAGLAGSPANPLVSSELVNSGDDLGCSQSGLRVARLCPECYGAWGKMIKYQCKL